MSTTTAGRPGGCRRRTVRQWAAAAAAAGRGLLADRLGRSTDICPHHPESRASAPPVLNPNPDLSQTLTTTLILSVITQRQSQMSGVAWQIGGKSVELATQGSRFQVAAVALSAVG